MATYNNGSLGSFKGKVGPIVGGKWKSIDWFRSYVIPSNPNTPAQQGQRSRMTKIVFIARQLLGSLIKPYWDKFYSDKSGYNAFVSENIQKLSPTTLELSTDFVSAKGNILGVEGLEAFYNPVTGLLSFAWLNNANGTTGLSTDNLGMVVVDKNGTVRGTKFGVDLREDTASDITIQGGLTTTNQLVSVFFYRGAGSDLQVSDSTSVFCTAS